MDDDDDRKSMEFIKILCSKRMEIISKYQKRRNRQISSSLEEINFYGKIWDSDLNTNFPIQVMVRAWKIQSKS
jgi:hypothetical protein